MAVPQRSVPDIGQLRKFYVGKHIDEVPKPAVILDRGKMKRHCESLSRAISVLGVDLRAHVKTHKVKLICITPDKTIKELTDFQRREKARDWKPEKNRSPCIMWR